jgi:group I intron endonuclease
MEVNKPFGIVYKATNSINNKCYIGITIGSLKIRKKAHKTCALRKVDNYHFHNAIRLYKFENFKWEILKECSSREELNLTEMEMIKEHHSHISDNGYNMNCGGDGNNGYIFPDEIKRKISNTLKGRKFTDDVKLNMKVKHVISDETKLRLKFLNKGRIHTDIARQNMSMAKKGEKHHLYGKHHSEETKRKISEKNKGYKHTEEDKIKMSINKLAKRSNFPQKESSNNNN